MTRSRGGGLTHRALATLVVTSTVVAGVAIGSTGQAGATPSVNCAKYMAYLLPGTTETNMQGSTSKDSGMLGNVGSKLKEEFGDEINVVYVPYSASAFDKGLSYQGSQHTGVSSAVNLMKECPDSEVVLAGYSQGADAMGDVAWHIGNENAPIKSSQVRGVALLADPKRGNEPVVGGQATNGQGIAGGREGGYGALANRIKWLCSDTDMYCNTTSKNPFAKVFGKLIVSGGSSTSVTPLDGSAPADSKDSMSELTSDFSNADLVGAKSKATDLKTRTEALANSKTAPSKDQVDEIGSLAKSLNSTYSAVDDVNQFAKTSGADKTLAGEKAGTPEAQTSEVLDVANQTDLGSLIDSTNSIATAASSLSGSLGSGDSSNTLTQGGEMFKDLALQAANVASSSSALNSVDRSNLTAATGVLSTLKVSTVVDTGLMALTVGVSTDYQGIFDDIVKIGQELNTAATTADLAQVKAAHTTSQGLLDKIEPWVDLADSANANVMPMAAGMVGAIPDPQGYAQIASLVMQLMSQVDIKAIWETARSAYDITGEVIDGKPEALVGLLPLGVNLASIGISALTGADSGLSGGTGAGTGAGTGGTGAGTGSGGGQALTSLVSQLGGAQDFTQLASDGLDYLSFLNSGAHTSAYTNKKMVGNMSAVDYMAEYFTAQLRGKQDGASSAPSSGSESGGSSSEEGGSSSGRSSRGDEDEPRKSKFGNDEESDAPSSSSRPLAKGPSAPRVASAREEAGVNPKVVSTVDAVAASASPTKLSVTVADVDGGKAHTAGGSPDTYAASTIKLGIGAAVLRKLGADHLDTQVAVNEVVGGSNAISSTGSYSAKDLLTAMITKSCNTATNALIDFVGGFDPVNETIKAAGVKSGYELKNKMMTTTDSILSSQGGVDFLASLWGAQSGRSKWLGGKEATTLIDLMRAQTVRTKLPKNIPPEAVANKTGENTGVSHDMGFITNGEKTYAVAVTTTGSTNDALIAKIGSDIYTNMV